MSQRVLALAHPLKTKPDKTHCALISAETKTDSASAKVTMIFPCPGKLAPWSPVASWYRLLPDLPAVAPQACGRGRLLQLESRFFWFRIRGLWWRRPSELCCQCQQLRQKYLKHTWHERRERETGLACISAGRLCLRGSRDSCGPLWG